MKQPTLFGNFDLTEKQIDKVTEDAAGAYLLGNVIRPDTALVPLRIGRSDDDLNARLKDYIGIYNYFQFVHCNNALEAYYKECELYHAFNPPDNKIHPDKPTGTKVTCPHCGI